MGYPTKVQRIERKQGADQWYINLPTAVAEAMDFEKGEQVHWHVEDKANLVLHRAEVKPSPVTLKKTLRRF
jgi:antitoxin component of MazEF toxin-antitoxin module